MKIYRVELHEQGHPDSYYHEYYSSIKAAREGVRRGVLDEGLAYASCGVIDAYISGWTHVEVLTWALRASGAARRVNLGKVKGYAWRWHWRPYDLFKGKLPPGTLALKESTP